MYETYFPLMSTGHNFLYVTVVSTPTDVSHGNNSPAIAAGHTSRMIPIPTTHTLIYSMSLISYDYLKNKCV